MKMVIITVEIKKTIDERETHKTTKEKQTKTKNRNGNRSHSERVRAKWSCCTFKLGFLQKYIKLPQFVSRISQIEYDKLYPSGSSPACIPGTPKMHNFSSSDSFPKLRPIVSSVGTFNYNFAHFFCDLLSPLVLNGYFCKDNFHFVSQIENANLSKKILVSYDVTSPFSDIPLQETIDIAKNLISIRIII